MCSTKRFWFDIEAESYNHQYGTVLKTKLPRTASLAILLCFLRMTPLHLKLPSICNNTKTTLQHLRITFSQAATFRYNWYGLIMLADWKTWVWSSTTDIAATVQVDDASLTTLHLSGKLHFLEIWSVVNWTCRLKLSKFQNEKTVEILPYMSSSQYQSFISKHETLLHPLISWQSIFIVFIAWVQPSLIWSHIKQHSGRF